MNGTPDNIVEWIFGKICNKLTNDGKDFSTKPFDLIKTKTFDNEYIHNIISEETGKDKSYIRSYLSDKDFQNYYLFTKLKNKVNVGILINGLIDIDHKFNKQSLQIAIINNKINLLNTISKFYKPNIEHLSMAAEFGRVECYDWLMKGYDLVPNISIYKKAVMYSPSIGIVKNISNYVGVSDKILEQAFKTNCTNIILYLVRTAISEKIKISENLVEYPVLNNNFVVLHEMEELKVFEWYPELYHTALLSGSMEMVIYVESKLKDIHMDKKLDRSQSDSKGMAPILLADMIYTMNDQTFFSHTINYAIQSDNIDILSYIWNLGYGITISNIITAIRQSSANILEFILDKFNKPIPTYVLLYLGINSYVSNKIPKIKIILTYDRFYNKIKNLQYVQKENLHNDLINSIKYVIDDEQIDQDYLLGYDIMFGQLVPDDIYLIVKLRGWLVLNNDQMIHDLIVKNMDKYGQLICDVLFIFGSFNQIMLYYDIILRERIIPPSVSIIVECICRKQINKFCYLIYHNLLSKNLIIQLNRLILGLADDDILTIWEPYYRKQTLSEIMDVPLKFILLSRNQFQIIKWIKLHPNTCLDIKSAKLLLQIQNPDILNEFSWDSKLIEQLKEWAEEEDLPNLLNVVQDKK